MSTATISLAVFTTTKGHYGRTGIYQNTIDSLQSHMSLTYFLKKVANIKTSSGHEAIESDMVKYFTDNAFDVLINKQEWKRETSGQVGYLNDIYNVYNSEHIKNQQYILHLEDDWLFHVREKNLFHHVLSAISILHANSNILQVRFPRFSDEKERIIEFEKEKNFGKIVKDFDSGKLLTNDFSINPAVYRVRDMINALGFLYRTQDQLEVHVEHGIGVALQYMTSNPTPFVVLDAQKVRVLHTGTRIGEEDQLDRETLAIKK